VCIITGEKAGTILPSSHAHSHSNPRLSFEFCCCQFPVRLAFGMTITHITGQSSCYCGARFWGSSVSHGPVYVAVSRGTTWTGSRFYLKEMLLITLFVPDVLLDWVYFVYLFVYFSHGMVTQNGILFLMMFDKVFFFFWYLFVYFSLTYWQENGFYLFIDGIYPKNFEELL